MSGPRVTSGSDSKQDYQTPDDFLRGAVEKRFGPIQFDLAAHAGNAKHARYFAPLTFARKIDLSKVKGPEYFTAMAAELARQGASFKAAEEVLLPVVKRWSEGDESDVELVFKNEDSNAYGFDALAHSWAELSKKFSQPDGIPGLLWLNCEFGDIAPWAKKAMEEGRQGANVLLLTPLSLANWYRDFVAGKADVDHLSGRLCFDGKNPFSKDCMLSHFNEGARGQLTVWNWKTGEFHHVWIVP